MSRAIDTNNSALSHVHNRTYLGEKTASPLIEWLNSGGRKEPDAIESLLNLLHHAERSGPGFEGFKLCQEIDSVRKSLDVTFQPEFVSANLRSKRWGFAWIPTGRDKVCADALIAVYELASRGLISRIRKCAKAGCNSWFWARLEPQKFHSRLCQEQDYHSSPEWKSARAEYMREARRRENQRQEAERKLHKRRG